MNRSGLAWGLLLSLSCGSGCTNHSPAQTPTQSPPEPVAAASAGIESATGGEEEAQPEVALRPVELLEANWAELQELIARQTGKIVVVDVWSTACEPCMQEFPHLISLQQRFPDSVVGISFDIDYAGIKNKPLAYYRERVLKFLGSQEESTVLHRMCTTAADELFEQIKLDSIPAVYVYGKDGQLLKRFDGSNSEGEGVSYEKQVLPFVGDLVK